MAHLLIWGTARDILSGGVTPGAKPQHVSSFAALQQAADGHDATLVLADAACLESEREAVLAWRKAGGAPHALLVAVAEARRRGRGRTAACRSWTRSSSAP